MRFIKQVGIELEGGWDKPPPHGSVGHDGSVKVSAYHVGEIASLPMSPSDVDAWVLANHPTATNETCGTHVHYSFKRLIDYARFADRETARKFVIRRLRNWGKKNEWGRIRQDHPFWGRLAGQNIYCKALWIPQVQIPCANKPETRRTQLNFCWGVHGTVELRVLPAFKVPEVTLAAIKTSIQAVDDYLAIISKKREKRLSVELEESDEFDVDERSDSDMVKPDFYLREDESEISSLVPFTLDTEHNFL